MVLVVVLDDGDGQDGEVREGEKVVEVVTRRHGQRAAVVGRPTLKVTKITFSPTHQLKSPPPTN